MRISINAVLRRMQSSARRIAQSVEMKDVIYFKYARYALCPLRLAFCNWAQPKVIIMQ
jgi:hypothetical protein